MQRVKCKLQIVDGIWRAAPEEVLLWFLATGCDILFPVADIARRRLSPATISLAALSIALLRTFTSGLLAGSQSREGEAPAEPPQWALVVSQSREAEAHGGATRRVVIGSQETAFLSPLRGWV